MPEPTKTGPVIRFHYIKSGGYRVVHADGVIGGSTPSGLLHLSFFSERPAIPTMVEHMVTVSSDGIGRVGGEVTREGKQGVVREVEVGAVMTVEMAKRLRGWLDAHIEKLDKALAQAEEPDAE